MMHAPLDEHRQLQRRLSMLSALQQETIRLEKRQRLEARGPNLLFAKLHSQAIGHVSAGASEPALRVAAHVAHVTDD